MKKLVRLFMFLSLVIICTSSFVIFAGTKEGDELVSYGDFEFKADELVFPDPVFGQEYGNAAGWGSLAFDSAALVMVDPDDSNNTVMKLSYLDEGQAWSSFFRFLSINGGTIYDISIDFKIVGSTDNIGFRFAGAPALEVVFLNHESKTAIDGKDGWYNVKFQFDTATGSYDSIALWFNSLSSAENYALLDNISVQEVDSDIELNVGGDFEGWLQYAPALELSETANSYGYFGSLSTVGTGNAVIGSTGYLGYEVLLNASNYRSSFDFTIDDLTNAEATVDFYSDSDTLITSKAFISEGAVVSENVTLVDNVYSFVADLNIADAASYIKINYSGDSSLVLDNLSVKELIDIPDNPFDPDTTYYEINQYFQNGDFEAFASGTVFSEEQLEGAWGSISLDGPAVISEVDGSKVMDLTKTAGKMYTSSFVITPPELMVNDLLRLRFDYKLDLESSIENINVVNASFVGASNQDYYTVDLKSLEDQDLTVGNELLNMPIKVTDNGSGWFTVEVDFKVDSELLIKCNSVRFLFTPLSDNDHLYVDNVELVLLDDEEPNNLATNIAINEDDQDLNIGDDVTLTASVTPSDATNATYVWSSSDETIATVDASGKVTALAKGAVTITVSLADESLSDSIIVTVLEAGTGCSTGCAASQSIAQAIGSFILAFGAILFIKKR
jgi:hypothetical protein